MISAIQQVEMLTKDEKQHDIEELYTFVIKDIKSVLQKYEKSLQNNPRLWSAAKLEDEKTWYWDSKKSKRSLHEPLYGAYSSSILSDKISIDLVRKEINEVAKYLSSDDKPVLPSGHFQFNNICDLVGHEMANNKYFSIVLKKIYDISSRGMGKGELVLPELFGGHFCYFGKKQDGDLSYRERKTEKFQNIEVKAPTSEIEIISSKGGEKKKKTLKYAYNTLYPKEEISSSLILKEQDLEKLTKFLCIAIECDETSELVKYVCAQWSKYSDIEQRKKCLTFALFCHSMEVKHHDKMLILAEDLSGVIFDKMRFDSEEDFEFFHQNIEISLNEPKNEDKSDQAYHDAKLTKIRLKKSSQNALRLL